ncbi:hypothetical protein [Leptolyngbya sp. FACHB-261]|uniref:hypothetical protein n=1 Tax=Leptolyngbya sp. FACHB-261 TaxID=2692806 RepID=UPI0016898292|nr:hypothetical protein [Leptolyngbya sp. FACHB-261]MBD2105171.1 hypothetical protein [Leptolyngbya sp. FACHB-261]
MTSSNGREPIDQRLDRLTATMEDLVRLAQEQRRDHESLDARLERVITAVVADSARLDRLLAAVEAQSQQISDLRSTAEAQERRLARLERRQ